MASSSPHRPSPPLMDDIPPLDYSTTTTTPGHSHPSPSMFPLNGGPPPLPPKSILRVLPKCGNSSAVQESLTMGKEQKIRKTEDRDDKDGEIDLKILRSLLAEGDERCGEGRADGMERHPSHSTEGVPERLFSRLPFPSGELEDPQISSQSPPLPPDIRLQSTWIPAHPHPVLPTFPHRLPHHSLIKGVTSDMKIKVGEAGYKVRKRMKSLTSGNLVGRDEKGLAWKRYDVGDGTVESGNEGLKSGGWWKFEKGLKNQPLGVIPLNILNKPLPTISYDELPITSLLPSYTLITALRTEIPIYQDDLPTPETSPSPLTHENIRDPLFDSTSYRSRRTLSLPLTPHNTTFMAREIPKKLSSPPTMVGGKEWEGKVAGEVLDELIESIWSAEMEDANEREYGAFEYDGETINEPKEGESLGLDLGVKVGSLEHRWTASGGSKRGCDGEWEAGDKSREFGVDREVGLADGSTKINHTQEQEENNHDDSSTLRQPHNTPTLHSCQPQTPALSPTQLTHSLNSRSPGSFALSPKPYRSSILSVLAPVGHYSSPASRHVVWSRTESGDFENGDPFDFDLEGTTVVGRRTPSPKSMIDLASITTVPRNSPTSDDIIHPLERRKSTKFKPASELTGWDDLGIIDSSGCESRWHEETGERDLRWKAEGGQTCSWISIDEEMADGREALPPFEVGEVTARDKVVKLHGNSTIWFERDEAHYPIHSASPGSPAYSVPPLKPDAPDLPTELDFQMTGSRVEFLHIIRMAAIGLNVPLEMIYTQEMFGRMLITYRLRAQDAFTLMNVEVEKNKCKSLHYTGHEIYCWYKSKFKEQTASTGSFQGFILGLIQLAFGKDIGESQYATLSSLFADTSIVCTMNGDCPERCPKSEERTAAFDDHECKTSDFSRACALQGEDSIGKSDIAEDHYTSIPLLPSSSQHRRLTEAHPQPSEKPFIIDYSTSVNVQPLRRSLSQDSIGDVSLVETGEKKGKEKDEGYVDQISSPQDAHMYTSNTQWSIFHRVLGLCSQRLQLPIDYVLVHPVLPEALAEADCQIEEYKLFMLDALQLDKEEQRIPIKRRLFHVEGDRRGRWKACHYWRALNAISPFNEVENYEDLPKCVMAVVETLKRHCTWPGTSTTFIEALRDHHVRLDNTPYIHVPKPAVECNSSDSLVTDVKRQIAHGQCNVDTEEELREFIRREELQIGPSSRRW